MRTRKIPYAKVGVTPLWWRTEVRCNGEKLDRVVEADAEEGWALCFHPEGADVCGLMVGPHYSKVHGNIEIIIPDEPEVSRAA